jgi:hypothetical protein
LQYNIISTFVLCFLYQRGDDGAPRALSYLQRSKAVLRPEIKATARCKKQLRDGSSNAAVYIGVRPFFV